MSQPCLQVTSLDRAQAKLLNTEVFLRKRVSARVVCIIYTFSLTILAVSCQICGGKVEQGASAIWIIALHTLVVITDQALKHHINDEHFGWANCVVEVIHTSSSQRALGTRSEYRLPTSISARLDAEINCSKPVCSSVMMINAVVRPVLTRQRQLVTGSCLESSSPNQVRLCSQWKVNIGTWWNTALSLFKWWTLVSQV